MNITKLRTNHLENPIGFLLNEVTFSWITVNTTAKNQEYAQIEISSDISFSNDSILFDSGKIKDINSLDYNPNIKLTSKTRYYWRVSIWADNGDYAISEPSFFETGKMDEKWLAKWISPTFEPSIHPLMSSKFTLSSNVVSARAYVCGFGIYEFEINGKKISNEYLTPGFHSYDYWMQYQTYDVTEYLSVGDNAMGATVGNGWYKGRFGFDGGYENIYGSEFALICEVVIKLADGTEKIITTDDNWRCHPSEITFSGIYDGEIYDANLKILNWSSSDCDYSDWQSVKISDLGYDKLSARLSLPILVKEQIKPVQCIRTPADEYVLDFGQNMTGWVEFKVNAPAGAIITLQYSEIMQNAVFYNENLRTAEAKYIYISDGKEAVVRPHFTYYGFRFVKVEGLGDKLNLDNFTACVVMSDLEQTGAIETSNPLVNKLFSNALWGQKSNFLDVPTDCPQRDERMGWTGDAQIFASTACYNMYSPAFYNKYMKDIMCEQVGLDGSVPFVVPMIKPKGTENNHFVRGHGSSAWGDAATVLPFTLYERYGDKTLLKSHYRSMKDWVDYIKSQDDKDGSKRLWLTGFHFGDWLALDTTDPQSPMGATNEKFVASAYYYYSTNLTAKAAKILGKQDDYECYAKLADEIKQAIKNEYFSPNGRITIDTQTALILSLYMDLIPQEFKVRTINHLKEKLEKNNMYLNTGFVGTPYFCPVLSNNDLNEYAYHLLLNDNFPSWLFEVKMGATTIWERWNSVLPDGSISGTGMNSLNHYAYGSIVDWMYRNMCGINPITEFPGFKKAMIKPQPSNRLSFAKAVVNSAMGRYVSSWEINNSGSLSFHFEVPFNASATIILPDCDSTNIIINGKKIYNAVQSENSSQIEVESGIYDVVYMPTIEYLVTH